MRLAYDVELIHYADHPVQFDRSWVYEQPPQFHKPNGLWVSVVGEDDWAAWISREREDQSALRHAYRVEVIDANILWITTAQGIDKLHEDYCYEDDFNRHLAGQRWSTVDDEFLRRQWPIDWSKLIATYDGLIIAPYQWERRLGGPFWYYSWDCASGCIWNTNAVVALHDLSGLSG
jgi:hypothetical protein